MLPMLPMLMPPLLFSPDKMPPRCAAIFAADVDADMLMLPRADADADDIIDAMPR